MIDENKRGLSPIALFAYRRPGHLKRTIEALKANDLASESELYIFCDGAKSVDDFAAVGEVRAYVETIEGFASVTKIFQPTNLGLSNSIVAGVTKIVNAKGMVIVIEDDIVTSPHFLKFMNEGLHLYKNEPAVASIHGYLYPVHETLPETFFLRGADCWGWATWKRAWATFQPDAKLLLRALKDKQLEVSFDLDNSYGFTDALRAENNVWDWDIRWHASAFLAGMLTLYPGRSLVENIGRDGSGEHAASQKMNTVATSEPVITEAIPIQENLQAREAVARYFRHAFPRRSRFPMENMNFPQSADPHGRVFTVKSEPGRIFRLILPEYREQVEVMLEPTLLSALVEAGMIDTWRCDHDGPNGELVLEHRYADINWPYEWSRLALKEAALFFVSLNRRLLELGYELVDAHSFNITMVDNRPVFIDWGSLSPVGNSMNQRWIKEAYDFYIFPLVSMALGRTKQYREFVRLNPGCGIDRSMISGDCGGPKVGYWQRLSVKRVLRNYRRHMAVAHADKIASRRHRKRFFDEFEATIRRLRVSDGASDWSTYYAELNTDFSKPETFGPKAASLHKIATTIEPEFVLDFAGNNGAYLEIFRRYSRNIKKTLVTDYDEQCIDDAFLARHSTALVVAFNEIGEEIHKQFRGLDNYYEPLGKRYKPDMVLALALIHHLVFLQGHFFEFIVKKLATIAPKFLVVEFVSGTDKYVSQWLDHKRHAWYTLDSMIASLKTYYEIDQIYPSEPESRTLILCRRKPDSEQPELVQRGPLALGQNGGLIEEKTFCGSS